MVEFIWFKKFCLATNYFNLALIFLINVQNLDCFIYILWLCLNLLIVLSYYLRNFSIMFASELRWVEHSLADLLSFILQCLSSNSKVSWLLASYEWTRSLLSIVGIGTDHLPRVEALNPRLLALQLLTSVLPYREMDSEFRQQVCLCNAWVVGG